MRALVETAPPSGLRHCLFMSAPVMLRIALFVVGFATGGAAETIHLFAFDDHALPFKSNLKLMFSEPQKFRGNPVVRAGAPGSVDSAGAVFYGSIIRVGPKFRLWYRAQSDGTTAAGNVVSGARLAYAESEDGLRWVKPEFGLAEFNGNRRNNLLGMPDSLDYSRTEPLSCFVLHEPDDPNAARRYKMAVYGRYYPTAAGRAALRMAPDNVPSSIYPFFSADGLTWTLAMPAPSQNWFDETDVPFPVRNNFEIGGLYKFEDIYYATGQELSPDIFSIRCRPSSLRSRSRMSRRARARCRLTPMGCRMAPFCGLSSSTATAIRCRGIREPMRRS